MVGNWVGGGVLQTDIWRNPGGFGIGGFPECYTGLKIPTQLWKILKYIFRNYEKKFISTIIKRTLHHLGGKLISLKQ